jgi:tetratricopeptide (TPR) repeat protein
MSLYRHTGWRVAGLTAGSLVVSCILASTVLAQGKGKGKGGKCQPDESSGPEMISARLYLQKATDAKVDSAEKAKDLKGAITALTPHDHLRNDVGQAYLLAEALSFWAAQPGATTTGSRGSFGFKDNPDGQVDILATADSLLTRVQTAQPECADMTSAIRQQAYVPIVNRAIQQLNAGQFDSADASAKRALTIYKDSPYAYNVLAGAAVKRNDNAAAATAYQQTIEKSGTDTSYTRLKTSAQYNLAVVTQALAEAATGPDKKAKSDSALALWRAYVAANPDDPNGKAGLSHALQTAGDTLSASALTSDMTSNPKTYTDVQIFRAAIAAARDNRQADAVKLFEAGLTLNPYFRDALYYVSTTYFNSGQQAKLFPAARRLIEIDPSNPDNYQLMAGAYQIRAKADKTPAAKKADTDTLLKFFDKYKTMPVRLTVSKFDRESDKLVLAGTVQNLSEAEKTYPLKFQFMDSTGTVVASQDQPPLTVPAKSSKDFTITVNQGGIAAYKYAPLE